MAKLTLVPDRRASARDATHRAAASSPRHDAEPTVAQATISPVIDRRLTRLLERCDGDHDGVLHARDFEEWVDRLGALRGWEPGSDGYSALTVLFVEGAYRQIQATASRDDGAVTLAEMRNSLVRSARTQATQVIAWADALFDLLDVADEGTIGRERYRDLLASLNIDRASADASFTLISGDGGRLGRDRFETLYLGFFLDEDPDATAGWFWGPVPVPITASAAMTSPAGAPITSRVRR